MNIKAFHHFCIHTSNYEASLAFYTELLGFTLVKDDLYAPKRLHRAWLERGPIRIELLSEKCNKAYGPYSNNLQGLSHLSFEVENIEEAFEAAKTFGAKSKSKHGKDIYRIKGGKQFKLIAPEGTEVEIRNTDFI